MPLAGLQPAIPGRERRQTHALDCAATGVDLEMCTFVKFGTEVQNKPTYKFSTNFFVVNIYKRGEGAAEFEVVK